MNQYSMLMTRCLLVVVLSVLAAPSRADEPSDRLSAAQEMYRAGDFENALRQLEPLLSAAGTERASRSRAQQMTARVLHARGEEHFRQARIAESLADFDRELQLQPEQAAEHWQRGIALYYAQEYDRGARQFELHQTVNPQDVENAAWHFLCVARRPKGSAESARKQLIAVSRDSRVPMAQIQKLFAGTMTPEDVLRAGGKAGSLSAFYADLYVGLYYEAIGRDEASLRLVTRAAENPAGRESYMGDVARVHVKLRTSKPEAGPNRNNKQAVP